jgi:hypothetical protein
MSDLSNDTKKHTTKSRETIPLNPFCYIVNAGGGTRGDSEFRRPEMWALSSTVMGVIGYSGC